VKPAIDGQKMMGLDRRGHSSATQERIARSRSGTPTMPNAKRTRPMVTLTLSPEALARLDTIASQRGQTRSGAVEALIRNARVTGGASANLPPRKDQAP
jgi:hypothetical protein